MHGKGNAYCADNDMLVGGLLRNKACFSKKVKYIYIRNCHIQKVPPPNTAKKRRKEENG